MSRDATATLSAQETTLPEGHLLARLPLLGAVLALLGLGAAVGLGGWGSQPFLFAYLLGFLFWLTLALGGLFFVLLHFLTRAGWSVVVRRLAEHVMGTLPLFALLFVPIALGVGELYSWTHPEPGDVLVAGKEPFLNAGGFTFRAVLYFAIWCGLAWWFRSRSVAQDASGDIRITQRLQTLSAPGMVLFAVTVSLASFDWIMSLDPHWYSTIFGVYIFAGCFLGILSLLSLLIVTLQRGGSIGQSVTIEHRHDIGKLLFAFVVFWGYIAFSQFLLIWYGNIPEETVWFAHRWDEPAWRTLSIALAVGHFVVPFFFLLPRAVKRSRLGLSLAALWLLAMHYLDLYWLVMPAYHGEVPVSGLVLALVLAAALVGVGGLFLGLLGLLMRKPALVPVRDPRLPESLSFENM